MRVMWRLAVVAVAIAACIAGAGAAVASDVPQDGPHAKWNEPVCDEGSCCDPDVECGWDEQDAGAFQASPDEYGYSADAYEGRCKTVYAVRTRKNMYGFVMFRYYEQVRWCWNGIVTTYVWRDRWPADTNFGWGFDGNVSSNCNEDHCESLAGGNSATAWTQGSFHACLTWFCIHKYPIVSISVAADGSYDWYTSG